jgi:hypothetical protein
VHAYHLYRRVSLFVTQEAALASLHVEDDLQQDLKSRAISSQYELQLVVLPMVLQVISLERM